METKANEREVIKHAAVRADNGMVALGKCHADCFNTLRGIGIDLPDGSKSQGFFTSKGRFVDRLEAFEIAKETRYIPKETPGNALISEMLWSDRDNGQFEYDSVKGYW